MYVRLWLHLTAMLIGTFAIGICMVSIIQWPVVGITACVLLVSTVAGIGANAYRLFGCGRTQLRVILRDIHRQVTLLTEEGYELLIPHSNDADTVWLRIGVDHNGVAYVEREGWNGALRRYTISQDGRTVRRSVLCDDLTDDDRAWCHTELTNQQLEYVLKALLGTYSPVQSVALA